MRTVRIQVAVGMSFFALMLSLFSYSFGTTFDTAERGTLLAAVCYDANNMPYDCSDEDYMDLLDGTTDTTTTENTTSDETVVDDAATNDEVTSSDALSARCPFEKKDNRTIVDFTNGGTEALQDLTIVANGTRDDAVNDHAVWLTKGVYNIHLASQHQIDNTDLKTSYNERWYVDLYNPSGSKIFTSDSIRYTYHDELYVEETVEQDAQITDTVAWVDAVHTAYLADSSFTLAPLCVAFDYQGALPGDEDTTETTTKYSDDPVLSTVLKCPLLAKTGRTIFDFTANGTVPLGDHRVSADPSTGVPSVTGVKEFLLPAGVYAVTAVSYGRDLNTSESNSQMWYLRLLNKNKGSVVSTPTTSDVSESETYHLDVLSKNFTVNQQVGYAYAQHGWFLPDDPNSVAPVCVVFDLLQPLNDTTTTTTVEPVVTTPTDTTTTVTAPTAVTSATVSTQLTAPSTASYNIFTGVEGEGASETSGTIVMNSDGVADVERVVTTYKSVGVNNSTEEVYLPTQVVEEREKIITGLDKPLLFSLTQMMEVQRKEVVRTYIELHETDEARVEEKTQTVVARKSIEEHVGSSTPGDLGYVYEAFRLQERTELDPDNKDSDGDGVTDYDEQYVYKTDPNNAFTGGDILTDGERILLGLNPKDSSLDPIPVESPRFAGEEAKDLFVVENIDLVQEDTADSDVAPQKQMRVRGKAQPSSFVTLYVYSTPIVVTVRTDESGAFEYLFDKTLEDGDHELFVASVNTSGKILAKSESFPFIKTAEAIEYTPIITVQMDDPVDTSMQTFVTFMLMLLILVVVGAVVWIGMQRPHVSDGVDTIEKLEDDIR